MHDEISLSDQVSHKDRFAAMTLVEMLRRRAAQQPEKRAYTFLLDGEAEEISLTYAALDLRARAIAESLIIQGLRGERAVLLFPPGLDFIAGFFGCLYAGLIAVPAYPPDSARLERSLKRLEAIAADAEAKAMLTTRRVLSSLEEVVAHAPALGSMKWLASDEAQPVYGDHGLTPFESSRDTIAFLQYTSGSTGRPKGVMLTHANLVHNASMVRAFCEHGPDDKYVSWLPAFHDMGFMSGILQPLYSGIPAVLMSPSAFLERPFRWLRAISRYRATTSGGPNFAYDLCVRKISPEERATLDLSSWTVAFNGAEPVRRETLERFAETFAPCGFRKGALYPCYGLAEATLIVTGGRKAQAPSVRSFETSALGEGRAVEEEPDKRSGLFLTSCGSTSEDGRLVIVHPDTTKLCAPGEIGEIWVSGPSVGQGYWRKPAETEQTFHAYVADTGEGPFLRTGDLGFIQGRELFVTGRLKDLIIIRGVNHYPQDIELTAERSHAALRPGCGAAFSLEVAGEEKLVVVQEMDDRVKVDPGEITDSIRKSVAENHDLEAYAVVLLKKGTIAKTSSGKIQRSTCRKEFLDGKLAVIDHSVIEDRRSTPGEESLIRKALLAIDPQKRLPIAESYILHQAAPVLGVSPAQLRPDRSLSALGLDSLKAVELKNQLEAQLGIAVSASKLLAGASARQIASLVLDELESTASTATYVNLPHEEADEYPLSFTQKALWFFYQLAPESAAYNTAFAVRISSSINTVALEKAFQKLVVRHPCLRTTFAVRDGQPVQRVCETFQARIHEAPVSALSEDELHLAITEQAWRPFDLERGPVYRVTLFTTSPQEHVLLLTVHHIVTDGWSFWVLVDELVDLYEAETGAAARLLRNPTLKYSDYVRWQTAMVQSEEGERLFEYWKEELSGELPALDLPTSRPRPPVQTYSGASYGFRLSDELAHQVKQLAVSRDATLFMVLLAAFQILLHRYTGQDDILVGSPISARTRAEFEGVVGCFFNAVVLRADFSIDISFEELLDKVRGKVLSAIDNQEYPSHLLVERLQPVRDTSRQALFQATFILQKRQRQGHAHIAFGERQLPAKDSGLALGFVPISRQHSRMELELEMIEADAAIHAWLHYNRDLFDAPVIERMAAHFQILLEGAAADPHQRLSSLPLLTEDEVEQLLAEQTPDLDSHDDSGLEEWFIHQVNRTPEKVATVYNDFSMTFNELNDRSDQLAGLISRVMN